AIVCGDKLGRMADTPRTATPRFERPYTVAGDLDLLRGRRPASSAYPRIWAGRAARNTISALPAGSSTSTVLS
ncbi:hypothetical protein, partial [Frankia sp. Cj5]|uniref:hypothetical protein n=1 Tax=Frankia sp. Cj5 TaxID=2880978 RepID=UPI001EF3E58B